MGDYGSPRVMGASGEAAAPMVAVLADQGLPGATGQRGLLKWVQSFYDLTSDSGQIKAREAYSKFKFTIDMGVGQLQKTLLDSLSGWSVIGDNDKSSKVKLYDFYKQTRDKFPKQPDSHPIVRV